MWGLFKKQIHEPIENQREDVRKSQPEWNWSAILDGEDCDQVGGAYGEFGCITNPTPVNGPMGEIIYLGKLRGETGSAVFFHRISTTGSPVSKHPLDIYETVCLDGTQWKTLYFDYYHPRRSNFAPPGYTLKPYDKSLKMDLPVAFGINFQVADFPYGLPEALLKLYHRYGHLGTALVEIARKQLNSVDFKRLRPLLIR